MTKSQTGNASSKYLVKRLVGHYVRPHVKKIIIAVICMVLVAASTAGNAWLLEPVLDDVFYNKDKNMLIIVPAAILALALIKGISTYIQTVIMRSVGQRVVTDLQIELYKHLLYSDYAFVTRESSGKIISRFTNDINVLRRSISNVMTAFVKEILTIVFLVALMFYQSFTLAVIAFFVFPVAVYPILKLGRRMRKISSKTQEELGEYTEVLDETFKGYRVIKSYQREDYEIDRASSVLNGIYKLYVKAASTEAATSPFMETIGGIAVALVIWYGGMQVMEGVTTPGAFTSFIAALLMAYKPVKSLSGLNTALQEGLAAAKRVFELLDTKPKIVDKNNAKNLLLKKGNIEFDNVKFSYDGKNKALKGISFKVKKGQMVALVGPSGGGKTTILNMLQRFFEPNYGSIKIDDVDISDVKIKSLREKMAFVSQETILFDDNVAANIGYGNKKASRADIEKAAKMAAASEFINDLPKGYDTNIGQNGFALSGGQRQRIAIARAMLRKAPILLLDEATSALDSVSEKKIQKALDSLMKGKTSIVIAHRLSTVINADCIYVVKKGVIVESGSHKELLKEGGEYAKLYKALD